MNPDRSSRVREICDAALAQSLHDRCTFLDHACAGDEELRREVEQALKENDRTVEMRNAHAPVWLELIRPEAQPGSSSGEQIGPYRILREIGRGGMGTVYLAERDVGRVHQRVALKVVRSGAVTRDILRRFEHEREILASLDHPNIARLLDLGTTGDGLPYLVMDYVDGEPIDSYCDHRKLTVAARLRLFLNVCSAVEYAHSRGVVHRDLKPSNIVVARDGSVRLLDFGIAKLTHAEDETATLTEMRPMTLAYASPEQLKGEALTVATDVYSLGVILYELLTGHWPYRVRSRVLHEIARVICEDDPTRASDIVAEPQVLSTEDGVTTTITPEQVGECRAEAPSRLKRRLAGDLDSILVKALRKESFWRYASATELSDDIRRHLDGFPVLAHENSVWYRTRKLLHRFFYPGGGELHHNSIMFIGWGIFGVLLYGERQAVAAGWKRPSDLPIAFQFIALIITFSVREARRIASRGYYSPMDRQASIVLGVTVITLTLVTVLWSMREVMSDTAISLFWNVGLGMALLIVGLQASRVLTLGGITLIGSAAAASLYANWLYLFLAIGMLGLIVPGVIFAFEDPPEFGTTELKDDRYVSLDL